jgi:hypothetical protein
MNESTKISSGNQSRQRWVKTKVSENCFVSRFRRWENRSSKHYLLMTHVLQITHRTYNKWGHTDGWLCCLCRWRGWCGRCRIQKPESRCGARSCFSLRSLPPSQVSCDTSSLTCFDSVNYTGQFKKKAALALDTEHLLLLSRHFATLSSLAAAARKTFSRQLQTNFESFPNNCISRDCRLTGYFIINMWKCYLLF